MLIGTRHDLPNLKQASVKLLVSCTVYLLSYRYLYTFKACMNDLMAHW